MLICAHCHHQNADDVNQCEACCSKLSVESSCPNCGHNHLTSARFCGHCGYLLEDQTWSNTTEDIVTEIHMLNIPELTPPEPLIDLQELRPFRAVATGTPVLERPSPALAPAPGSPPRNESQRQSHNAVLIHKSTQFRIPLNQYQFPIHLGKPNRKMMPDIDLSTFQHSEIVSRIHADIQIKDNKFVIRDSGSVNGTFVNNYRIQPGQIKSLESGDKISLGQGDLVTFIFELS